jgi:hypothetical protein
MEKVNGMKKVSGQAGAIYLLPLRVLKKQDKLENN